MSGGRLAADGVPWPPAPPALGEIARIHGATETQIALSWLLHRSPQMLPIPGTRSAAHVRENVAALDIDLTAQELAQLA